MAAEETDETKSLPRLTGAGSRSHPREAQAHSLLIASASAHFSTGATYGTALILRGFSGRPSAWYDKVVANPGA